MKFRSFLSTFFLLSFLFFTNFTNAQSLESANKDFEKRNYTTAVKKYLKILQNTASTEAKINLAKCYLKLRNFKEAEYWYSQVIHLREMSWYHYLFYAQALEANGKCDLARKWFLEYQKMIPSDISSNFNIRNCEERFIAELVRRNEGIYTIEKTPFNSNYQEEGIAFYKNGIVFSSGRGGGKIDESTGQPYSDLYYLSYKINGGNFNFGSAERFMKNKYHDGALTFNAAEDHLLLTQSGFHKRKKMLGEKGMMYKRISTAVKRTNGWSELIDLPINSFAYNIMYPAWSADGQTLYFASDMPGGFGGIDLYKARCNNGEWQPPINLGPKINTEGHEIYPFIDRKTNDLYFTSNGHAGLGGYDIFRTKRMADGKRGSINNLGIPINSQYDDVGFVIKDNHGFFSSTRANEGGTNSDIYAFQKAFNTLSLIVQDKEGKELVRAIEITNDCTYESFVTSGKQAIQIEVAANRCCDFSLYYDTLVYEKIICLDKDVEPFTTVIEYWEIDLPFVKKERMTAQPNLNPISIASGTSQSPNQNSNHNYLTYAKHLTNKNNFNRKSKNTAKSPNAPKQWQFEVEGVVLDVGEGKRLKNVEIELYNECDGKLTTVRTGNQGEYKLSDLDSNCCYQLRVKTASGTTKKAICKKDLNSDASFLIDVLVGKD